MNTKTTIATALLAATATIALSACGTGGDPVRVENPDIVMPSSSALQVGPDAGSSLTTTTASKPKTLGPLDTALSKSTGAQITILSVEDEATAYGPAVVFTFQINNASSALLDDTAWVMSSPVLVYGPAGTPAKRVFSTRDNLGMGQQGAIPPGSKQTIREGFENVSKADLTEAVVTVGSLVWQGDFASLSR